MNPIPKIEMSTLGFSSQFAALATKYPALTVGRIVSQEKGLYRVISEHGELFAKMAGRFRHEARSVSDFPAVGDFVMMNCKETKNKPVIHYVLQRKSVFIRKAARTAHKEQVVAANIDTIFLCMSLNNDFNLRRLERYLSLCWKSGARPVVVLTKADLCEDIAEKLSAVKAVAMGADILVSSTSTQNGHEQILPYIKAGQTVALVGSSGVGKSTLINCLLGENLLKTNDLRNDGRGRHTTRRRELIILPDGGLVIDTPGMRELGMWDIAEGLDKTFADIEAFSAQCRFKNCSHTTEPDCAIKMAIECGNLLPARWQSYQKLQAESAYGEDAGRHLMAKEHVRKNISKTSKSSKR